MWSSAHTDACAAYLAGDKSAPASEWVESGTRLISVPCHDWFMRQPLRIQVLYLIDIALAVVFLLNSVADLRGWIEMRRRMRRP